MLAPAQSQPTKLLDEARRGFRFYRYSLHTEQAYVDWIVRLAHRLAFSSLLSVALISGKRCA